MPGSSTVIVAREDLSIPGSDEEGLPVPGDQIELERRFFELVHDSRPDVVVLDLCDSRGDGTGAILKIRRTTVVPILVVCGADDPRVADYRIAGAAECISAPIDIVLLNQIILRIKRVTRPENLAPARHQRAVVFAGIVFRPEKSSLSVRDGAMVRLTTAEHELLSHLLSRPWTTCSRAEIGEMLYGRHRPKSDRAIDVVVARLRKKLVSLAGPSAEDLVQTKHRWGYMLAADVSPVRRADAPLAAFGARDGEAYPKSTAEASPV